MIGGINREENKKIIKREENKGKIWKKSRKNRKEVQWSKMITGKESEEGEMVAKRKNI